MNTKLTLTMDKAVIEMAKKYAKEEGRSLSDLVENYFKMISSSYRTESKISEVAEDPTPFTTSLLGVMKVPKDFDPKQELQERREKKVLEEMKSVLIDSNIIIDVLAYREPFVNDSKKIIEMCELNEIHGYTTTVILANVYYLMQKQLTDTICRTTIKNLLNTIDVLQMGKPQILKALDSNFKDFEDALQNYSAEASEKIDTIITRNIKDYKHSRLAVMTPELFLKSYL